MEEIKLNLGAGSWRKEDWTNLDKIPRDGFTDRVVDFSGDYQLVEYEQQAAAIFASHVLEHLRTENVRRLLSACYGALKSGGVMRILVPDYDKFKAAYLDKAWKTFYDNDEVRKEIALEGENCAARFICSIARYAVGSQYEGPPTIGQRKIQEQLDRRNDDQFITWVCQRLPKKEGSETGVTIDHCNAFNEARLKHLLESSGFPQSQIIRMGQGDSMDDEMKGPEFSNRQRISLIMEAVK